MTKEEKQKCLDCINCDTDGGCIAKREAPFDSFVCEHNEQFEPLDTGEIEEKMNDEVIPLEKLGKRGTVRVYTQSYVEQLKKENTELKARLNAINLLTPELQKASNLRKQQLTKAKEIIKTFLGFAETFGYSPSMDKFITEAEQFLKEE